MKKNLLSLLFVTAFLLNAWAQNPITITFSGQNEYQTYVRLDSVLVTDVTRNWSEMLIYPDTVIELNNISGVNSYPKESVIKLTPNPLRGNARISFQLNEEASAHIQITDLNGRKCASWSGKLSVGEHSFNVTLTVPQMYVLTVRTPEGTHSVKMLNTANGGKDQISYIGSKGEKSQKRASKGILTHDILPGDLLKLTGYANIDGILRITRAEQPAPNENSTIMLTFFSTDSVPCPGLETVTDYDGNVYNTIQMGSQCWMQENLRTTRYANGTEIPLGSSANSSVPYRYYPNYDSASVSTYGYLYNWSAFINGAHPDSVGNVDVQGVCPAGWHLPSLSEWNQLINHVKSQPSYLCNGGSNNIAKALASKTGWANDSDGCTVGNHPENNNATGFNGQPSGGRYSYDTQFGQYANFWMYSATGDNTFQLAYWDYEIWKANNSKSSASSVRCIYGDGISQVKPIVTTAEADVDGLSFECGGIVASDGGTAVTARGICWSTSQNPTLADSHTDDGIGTGMFTSTVLTGLTAGATYYVRAYATNSEGTSYGEERMFMTFIVPAGDAQPCPGAATVTDYDGNVYNTVLLGNQCWMKENLRTTHYSDGTAIALGLVTTPDVSYLSVDSSYYYLPQSDSTLAVKYGYLYNWAVVMNGATGNNANPSGVQGICPTGWHLPSSAECSQFSTYLGSQPVYRCDLKTAKSLASTARWHTLYWDCTIGNEPGTNNATRFSAYPAGYYHGNIQNFGDGAYFWTATTTPETNLFAYSFLMYFNSDTELIVEYEKQCGLSVRCLRN